MLSQRVLPAFCGMPCGTAGDCHVTYLAGCQSVGHVLAVDYLLDACFLSRESSLCIAHGRGQVDPTSLLTLCLFVNLTLDGSHHHIVVIQNIRKHMFCNP